MPDRTNQILAELNTLLRLTQAEATVAQIRRIQAANDEVEHDLATNAEQARERTQTIAGAIQDLGGVPNVLSAAVGRLSAVARAQLEQGLPLSDGLMADLALEQQLRDRARYLQLLAKTADKPDLVRLGERLEAAHSETIEWINAVLADVAAGQPAAVRPTPVQSAVGFGRRILGFPVRQLYGALNRSVAALGDLGQATSAAVEDSVDRAASVAEATREVVAAGRDATLEATEQAARERGADEAAETVHRGRQELGALEAEELPIANYDNLNADRSIKRIRGLREPEEIDAVLRYERAHKNRKSVISAAEDRLRERQTMSLVTGGGPG